jgi:hypothetical protein
MGETTSVVNDFEFAGLSGAILLSTLLMYEGKE